MKRVAVVQDLAGFGRCSLTAALPVLSALGVQACPLPTAILSNQTGYASYFLDDYTDRMGAYISHWQQNGAAFDGIYTGFLLNAQQLDIVLHFLDAFQTPATCTLVDPIMGDNGYIFPLFSHGLAEQMRRLVARATVITPNLTEACYLAGASYAACADDINRIYAVGRTLLQQGPRAVVITGVPAQHGFVRNVIVQGKDAFFVETPTTHQSYSGTGDLFASVVCGCLVRGAALRDAVTLAATFISNAAKDANGIHNEGIPFERHLSMLTAYASQNRVD